MNSSNPDSMTENSATHSPTPDSSSPIREISVVVPLVNTISDATDCLMHLDAERNNVDLEVLLVNRIGDEAATHIGKLYPWVTILPVSRNTTIPAMRK